MTSDNNPKEERTGSPAPGEPDFIVAPGYLVIGKLRRPHGVSGEMVMEVLTDFPERLKPGVTLYRGREHVLMHVRRCRKYDKGILISFEEVNDMETAGLLRNEALFVRTDDVPDLPEGEYYHHQILGLRAVGDDAQYLGIVVDILETGANDVAVVSRENGGDILIPLVDEFIHRVDLQAGVLHVKLMEGLIPGEPAG